MKSETVFQNSAGSANLMGSVISISLDYTEKYVDIFARRSKTVFMHGQECQWGGHIRFTLHSVLLNGLLQIFTKTSPPFVTLITSTSSDTTKKKLNKQKKPF
eukprot:PhF_6_TR26236/c0_g2_i1/m.37468